MTAHVKTRYSFAHSTDRLIEAIRDPDFHDAKIRWVGEPGSRVMAFEVDPAGDELVVVSRQVIDRRDLPGVARRFAGGHLHADREETWSLTPIWSTGEFTVDVPGAPMRSGGRISVLSDGDEACTLKVRTFISVSAPLVSRGIEKAMAENVRGWLRDENEFTTRWLDGGRS